MTCSAFHPAPSVQAWLQSSQRHLPLAEGTVIELSRRIQRWQSHPDGPAKAPAPVRRRGLRARDRLVCHNLRLVSHVWGRHRQSLPIHEETTADALQEAAMSLLRAAEKYDPTRGYRFSTYASFWVRKGFSEIEKHQKRLIRFPAEKAAVVLKAQRLRDEQEALTGEAPSLVWLAPRCSLHGKPLKAETLAALLLQWQQTQTGTLENRRDEDGEGADSQRLTMASMRHDSEQERGMDPHWETLPRLLAVLNPAQQQVIEGLYLQQPVLSRPELQRRLRLTPLDLRALEQEALEKMRAAVG